MTWSVLEVVRSLGTCPWTTLARRALGLARRRPIAPDLRGMQSPWATDAIEALARAGAEVGAPGATWLPVLGVVPWSESRAGTLASDDLTTWMGCRLTDAFHAARVAALTRDEAASEQAVAIVKAFRARHPLGSRPAWDSAMEAALRAVRLLHVGALLRHAGAGDDATRHVADALADHEAFLGSHADWRFHFTGNHHLVALAGTFMLAVHLPSTPAREREARRAWTLFWRELRREVEQDGLHFESSTGYHLLVAETAAHVAHAGARFGRVVPRRAARRLAAMARATAALSRPDGTLAPIGDSDDGAFLDLSPGPAPPKPLDARPALLLLALATGEREAAAVPADARATAAVAWAAGSAGLSRIEALRGDRTCAPACFPFGGMAVLATPSEPVAHVTVSSTSRGRAGTGGHGHDDAGSYELWLGGELVVDRGTGAYGSDPELRRRLRSVRGHAVVQVDARDQNPASSSLFRRPDRSKPLMTAFATARGGAVAVGHHGYCTSPGAVTVLRRISLSRSGALEVVDELAGCGEHDVVLRLPWAPGVALRGGSTGEAAATLDVVRDGRRIASLRAEAITGDGAAPKPRVAQVAAEHATRQREIVAATTTEISWHCRLPVTLRHEIRPSGSGPA